MPAGRSPHHVEGGTTFFESDNNTVGYGSLRTGQPKKCSVCSTT
ncbi:hypothetical protein ACIGXQ_37530 [Streptomyces anulatus]